MIVEVMGATRASSRCTARSPAARTSVSCPESRTASSRCWRRSASAARTGIPTRSRSSPREPPPAAASRPTPDRREPGSMPKLIGAGARLAAEIGPHLDLDTCGSPCSATSQRGGIAQSVRSHPRHSLRSGRGGGDRTRRVRSHGVAAHARDRHRADRRRDRAAAARRPRGLVGPGGQERWHRARAKELAAEARAVTSGTRRTGPSLPRDRSLEQVDGGVDAVDGGEAPHPRALRVAEQTLVERLEPLRAGW